MKKKTIGIRKDQEEWIQEHTEITLSGFAQEVMDELIEEMGEEKKDFEDGEGGRGRIPL